MDTRITFTELFGGTLEVLGRNWRLIALFAVALGLADAVFTTGLGEGGGSLLQMIAGLAAGYFLLMALLKAEGFVPRDGPVGNFGGYLGAMVLSGLGTIGGFLLLVLPGLIFMARWSMAGAIAISENIGGTAAMRDSWEATRASQWSLVGFYVVLFLLLISLGGLAGGVAGGMLVFGLGSQGIGGGAGQFMVLLVTGIASQAATACSSAVVMAIMHKLRPADSGLGEVFA